MGTVIGGFNITSDILCQIWFAVLFYLSLKSCFWKEGKSKIKLVLLSLVTGPFFCYLMALSFSYIIDFLLWPEYADFLLDTGSLRVEVIALLGVTMAVIYLAFILLFAWLSWKWLGTGTKSSMLFIYIMFNTISVITTRGTGSGMMFSVPYLREIINFIENVILFLAGGLLYRLVVLPLSKMKDEIAAVRFKTFNIPPAVLTFFYTIYTVTMVYDKDIFEEKMVVLIHVFSSFIIFLFIWAFYLIINNINATNEAVKAKDEVKALSVEVMEALAHTIDAKDEYTRGHSIRVAKYSRMLAQKLGLSAEDCENVYYMGLLHDIGKIGVPNEIINSTTKLTDEEYAVIKTHPGVGYDILAEIKSRPDLSIGARWHHERYDGRGYPDGKSGTEIPLFARIIAVADSYDAMTSNRSYRKYLPQEVVRAEIEKNMGIQFDPDIARCMLTVIDDDVNYELHE